LKRVLAAAVAAAFSIVPNAQAAGTANNNFNVTTTLTSQCTATNSGTQTVDFAYTAFQTGPQAGTPVNLLFQCTRGFGPITAAFDTVNGTAAGVGVISGLQYTLTAASPTNGPGTPASVTSIGTGDLKTFAITGTMPPGQAGDCATSTCTPAAVLRTLIVTF